MGRQRACVVSAVLAALMFLAPGCGGGGEGGGQPAQLSPAFVQKANGRIGATAFPFSASTALFQAPDPRSGQGVVLNIGRFDGAGQNAAFSLRTDDGSLEGGMFTAVEGGCSFNVTYRALAGQPPEAAGMFTGPIDFYSFDQCGVDGQGQLALMDSFEGTLLVSQPGSALQADLAAVFTLSPDEVVASPVSLAGRPEHGGADIRLVGNLLIYSLLLEGLDPASVLDRVEEIDLHRGDVGETGPAEHIVLMGQNMDPMRGFSSGSLGAHQHGSIFVTAAEAAALKAGTGGYYLTVGTVEVPTGLLRGQISPLVNPITTVLEGHDAPSAAGMVATLAGGEVSAQGENGTGYHLVIPPRVYTAQSGQAVTLTPVREILGLPISGSLVAAAQLTPDGKVFDGPVQLIFDVPEGFARSRLLAFTYSGDGTNLNFVPLPPASVVGNQVTVSLTHFSTAGVATGGPADIPPPAGVPGSLASLSSQLAQLLAEAISNQLGGADAIPASVWDKMEDLLADYFVRQIRPLLVGITTLEAAGGAYAATAAWYSLVQTIPQNATLEILFNEAIRVIGRAVEELANLFDKECIAGANACIKLDMLKSYAQWKVRADDIGGLLEAPLNIPEYFDFCDQLALKTINDPVRLEIQPDSSMALAGAPFQLVVAGYNGTGNSVPVADPRWRVSPPGVADVHPLTGSGTAFTAGVTKVFVEDPSVCVDPAEAVVNVRDLTGSWAFVGKRDATCPEDIQSFVVGWIPMTQVGSSLQVSDPNYGTVTWSIPNFSTAAVNREPYRITSGTITSSDGQYCQNFFADIAGTLDDETCLPPNRCEPISCSQTDTTTGALSDDALTFSGTTQWSDQLSWFVVSQDSTSVRIHSFCEGTDTLTAKKN